MEYPPLTALSAPESHVTAVSECTSIKCVPVVTACVWRYKKVEQRSSAQLSAAAHDVDQRCPTQCGYAYATRLCLLETTTSQVTLT